MSLLNSLPRLSAGALLCALALPAAALTEIELYHQLDSARAQRLSDLVEQFNGRSKDYKVNVVQKTVNGVPAVLNLATPETVARFAESQGKFRPLHQVMADTKANFNSKTIAPELRVRVSDPTGKLVALPLAMSTAVLYYNKAAFRKVGLDPEKPPKTWWELQEMAGTLRDGGMRCPYTTSWPAWVHIDNNSALNASDVAGPKGELAFNGLVQVKHIALLASWHKTDYFKYYGRRDEADKHFAAGECGILTSSSALAATLRDSTALDVGIAPLPHYDDVHGAPQHTLVDGGSLWIGEGRKPAEYKAAAAFVQFLMTPEVQVEIIKLGGYLPLTPVARAAAASTLLAGDLAGLNVAMGQLKKEGSSHPVRVSQIEPVRIIVEEELEAVWADKKTPKEALDTAVVRGNLILAKGTAPAPAKSSPKKKCANCPG